jgi:hypothetical protein
MNDMKLVRDKSDKKFFCFLLCMIGLFVYSDLCFFVTFDLVISDIRMMSFAIKLDVLREISIVEKEDLLLIKCVFDKKRKNRS